MQNEEDKSRFREALNKKKSSESRVPNTNSRKEQDPKVDRASKSKRMFRRKSGSS